MGDVNKSYLVFAVILSCVLMNMVDCRQSLRLVQNRYEGLTVSISEDVPQEHCNRIIHGLKEVLSRFSNFLFDLTGGRASLRDATISLPRSWKTNALTCSLLEPVRTSAIPSRPHITVKGPHPLFGTHPWTQQSQGCGRPGDFIQMGSDILRTISNETHTDTARELLGEWVKFRWGIFEESGYPGDPLYPAYYRDPVLRDLRPNQCYRTNEMKLPFCDSKGHVPEAPTKHNALCMGRPAWDIIQQSEDFANERNLAKNNSGTPPPPTFQFVQQKTTRIILAVEDTAVMNMQKRWEFIRKAVRRTVVYDLPDDSYFGLVVFNSIAHTVAPLTKINSITDVRLRIGSSLPRNPSTVPESHKCLLCGLQEAIRELESDPEGSAGANIIMVTTGARASTAHQLDEMVRLIESRGVRVTPILYPLSENPGGSPSSATSSLEPLVRASGNEDGRLFTVVDEGVGNDSKVNMMVSLMDALLAAIKISSPPDSNGTPLIVHSESYPGGISSVSSGTFNLDNSLGPSARFSVYYYDLNHVGNTIQLMTPSGAIMMTMNRQEEDGDANVILVNIDKAERGIWSYKVDNRADSHQGLHIQVTAHENPNSKIKLNLWTSAIGGPLRIPDVTQPLILYAELKDGGSPIIGAQVRAKMQRLGTNSTGFPYQPVYIELLDNGVGDPDITRSDGVYSRYLPQVYTFPGHYELSVSADNNNGMAKVPSINTLSGRTRMFGGKTPHPVCCGSVLNYDNLKAVAPFQREVAYGILNVVASSPDTDAIPPSRILDLRVDLNKATKEVILTWTAPGDDYDWGRAHHYEAVLASSWAQAKAFDGIKINNLPVPHMVSNEQRLPIKVKQYDQIKYIAMRAVDSVGNKGGVSNIASVWVTQPATVRPPLTTSHLDLPSIYSTELQGQEATHSVRLGGFSLEDVAVIAGAVGGFLIILIILCAFCYCHVTKKRKDDRRKDAERNEANKNITIKSNGSMILDQDESRDSADSTAKDAEALKDGRSLSPVQSWAASKLLDEHERRFSVSSGPTTEQQQGTAIHYGANLHDPFPDVTLTGTHAYPASQTPSTTHSDPPAYQAGYVTDGYAPYPYPTYHTGYANEELPPYTPGLSSQSSQGSSAYTQEMSSQPSEISYPIDGTIFHQDMPAFVGDLSSYAPIPPPAVYNNPIPDSQRPPQVSSRKVPPPVAPKPATSTNRSNISPTNSSSEPKRRNVTQV